MASTNYGWTLPTPGDRYWYEEFVALINEIDAQVKSNQLTDYTQTVSTADVYTKGPWVDVRAYGAKGDGVTNDTVAIQAALTAAGDGKVLFPVGTYLCKDLNPPSYCVMEGIGKGSILKAVSAPTNGVIHIQNSNVMVRNLKVHGNNVGKGIYISSGGYSSRLARVFISHCSSDALHINNANDVKLDDCEFITCSGTQIVYLYDATQCFLSRCRLENSPVTYAIYADGSTAGYNTAETITVNNCWLDFAVTDPIVDTIRLCKVPARIVGNYFVVPTANASHANHINVVAGGGTSGHVRIIMNDFHRKGSSAKHITISSNAREVEMIMNRIDDPLNDISDSGTRTYFMGNLNWSTDDVLLTMANEVRWHKRGEASAAATLDLNSSGTFHTYALSANALDIDGDHIKISTSKTPSSSSDTGTQGNIAWDLNYVYVCTAANTWGRAALDFAF